MGKKNKVELQQWNPASFQVSGEKSPKNETKISPLLVFLPHGVEACPGAMGCSPISLYLCLLQGTHIWASPRDFLSKDTFGRGAVKVEGERTRRWSHWKGQADERQHQRLRTGRANGCKKFQLCAWQKVGAEEHPRNVLDVQSCLQAQVHNCRLKVLFWHEYYQEGQVVMPKPLVFPPKR